MVKVLSKKISSLSVEVPTDTLTAAYEGPMAGSQSKVAESSIAFTGAKTGLGMPSWIGGGLSLIEVSSFEDTCSEIEVTPNQ